MVERLFQPYYLINMIYDKVTNCKHKMEASRLKKHLNRIPSDRVNIGRYSKENNNSCKRTLNYNWVHTRCYLLIRIFRSYNWMPFMFVFRNKSFLLFNRYKRLDENYHREFNLVNHHLSHFYLSPATQMCFSFGRWRVIAITTVCQFAFYE